MRNGFLLMLVGMLAIYAQAAQAASVVTATVGPQSSTNSPGGTQSYVILIGGNGNGTLTFGITNLLPAGATATFNPSAEYVVGNGPANSWTTNTTLTITTTTATPPGTYPFTIKAATGGGSGNVAYGSGTLVVNTPTSTSLSSSANPIGYGQTVTFTASVSGSGAGTPTGTVTFMDGAQVLGSSTLDTSGQATFSTNRFTVAGSPHAITATYSGDASFQGSASVALSQVINAATLTVTGVAGVSKVYDGSTAAALDLSGAALAGLLSGDVVSLNTVSAAGTFADKNVGTGKLVTGSGLALSGADAGNYVLIQPTATADITTRPLVVSATGVSKMYDGTTAATVTLSDNRVAGDQLSESYTAATFVDKNVGTGKTITVTGISLTGTDAGNYTFNATAATTANITARSITVTAVTDSKVYDGTTSSVGVPVISGAGLATGDTAVFTQTFDTKNAGTGKTLTPSGQVSDGKAGNNYNVTLVAVGTGSITPASLTIKADDKIKVTGIANPVLTATYAGFVAGEDTNALTTQVVLATTAVLSSPPGLYPITASGATAQNYAITFTSGVLTVVEPPVLTNPRCAGNQFLFDFQSVDGQTYQVEVTETLPVASWSSVGAVLTGTGGSLTVTNDTSDGLHLFRVAVLPRTN